VAGASRLSTDRVGDIPLSSPRIDDSQAPDVSARSGVLVAGGKVLWSRKPTTPRPMASTTKVMTALLALENCDLDEVVTVTKSAANTPYAVGLRTGERRTVRTLLKLLLVASSNDAANALAIHIAGGRPAFVEMMNERAEQLGLDDTRYKNAHGLDADGHYTSSRDLANLMRAAVKHEEFKRIIRLRSVTLRAYGSRPARTLKATDELLGTIEGFRGGKTGYTDDADYCFVGSARRDGLTLTSVVLGSPTSSSRFRSTRRLLEWGFRNYGTRRFYSSTPTIAVVPASENPDVLVPVRWKGVATAKIFTPLGAVKPEASLPSSVTIPVFAGQPLGVIRFVQAGSVLTTAPAVASRPRASAIETVAAIPVIGRAGTTVIAKTPESTASVAAYDPTRAVDKDVRVLGAVTAPVLPGMRLGSITYRQDGRVLVSVPVVAANAVR
jgi:D-alanyl-D-alanine carboxypeptidase (penicillin-binding protein 5/6)